MCVQFPTDNNLEIAPFQNRYSKIIKWPVYLKFCARERRSLCPQAYVITGAMLRIFRAQMHIRYGDCAARTPRATYVAMFILRH